nr:MAG TPA: Thymidylate synthase [Caudoviricetes sp.]
MSEKQYLSALKLVRNAGSYTVDRTGVGTRWFHGVSMRFWLAGGRVPLLQTKKVNWRAALDELLWFIRGEHNTNTLGSGIWDAWADEGGELGPIYGVQWRGRGSCHIDQLTAVIEGLKTDPHSRRHVVSAWIPDDIGDMALPPCHTMFQFNMDDKRNLYCSLYMRSGDMFLGVPFNIFEYGVLTHMVAKLVGAHAYELRVYIANAHIYVNHLPQVNTHLCRSCGHGFPRLKISGDQTSIDDFEAEDFKIVGYHPLPPIKAPVAV